MEFESVIGLEVHIQLNTKSKLFCSAPAHFGEEANSHIDPVTFGLPGALPVANNKAVRSAVMLGLATKSQIAPESTFARKHYFYPDLPKGYQISQFEEPICSAGYVPIQLSESRRNIGLIRIHLEEDAGKSMHDPAQARTLVDLNRAGVPLLEVVSQPDLRTPKEAVAFLKKLRQIARYLGISDGNMEEGSMRCDANISLRPKGELKFGTRTEVKNLNSFKFVERALEYEIARHLAVLKSNKEVVQETRLFDSTAGTTRSMRSKEESADYRYMPDPDLPTLEVSQKFIADTRKDMPVLPDQHFTRLTEELGLSSYDAEVLSAEPEILSYFDELCEKTAQVKLSCNWVTSELFGALNQAGLSFRDNPFPVEFMAELIGLVERGDISGKMAKSLFTKAFETKRSPQLIAEEEGLRQTQDPDEIGAWVSEVVEANPAQANDYRDGKKKLFGFFVGQVMQRSGGKANPEIVTQLLREKLDSGDE